jgi:hypothetical protein
MELLSPLHSPPSADAEGEAAAGVEEPPLLLKELASLAELASKTAIGAALVCSDCLGDATKEACLDSKCPACGFQRLWSKGMRTKVLQLSTDKKTESMRSGVSSLWEKQLNWDVVKSSDGDSDDRDLRHTVTGTITELLDACEAVYSSWVPHRFHAMQARAAEIECDQNLTPAKLRNNSDWSENGEIVLKHQMQSEYWSIKYYSLLISITSFLVASAWKDRVGALDANIEVTVQPVDTPCGSICYTAGSYFAVVQEGSSSVGPDVLYLIKRTDGSTETVPRHRLRHRLWHHVAFLGVTNEKQHVATTTQAFFARQLEFWRLWNDEGRDAAHAFAAKDRASAPPPSPTEAALPATAAASVDTEMDPVEDLEGDVETDATGAVAANAAAAKAAATCAPPTASAISAAAIALANPKYGAFLAELNWEKFTKWLGHADNATHFKSSGNLHWWSNQQDTLSFIHSIWLQYGCPGKGKGPWDGLGAMVKTSDHSQI